MKKQIIFISAALMVCFLVVCSRDKITSEDEPDSTETENIQTGKNEEEDQNSQEDTEMKLQIDVDGSTFSAALEDNEAVTALVEMLKKDPVVIEMDDYSGFEKVGSLGTSLPASNSQMTTRSGDIVLYNSSQIVMFYGSNSWSYTKLAQVDDLTGWEDALGNGSVTVTLSVE